MTLTDLGAMTLLAATASACLIAGCSPPDESGPPDLRFGRDECAECKMSIIDQRSAAAMRVATPHGTETLLFDDLGCLLDYERWHADVTVTERWTCDYGSKAWARAEPAHYVFSEKIHTPMGSWIAAYASPADADACHAEHGGDKLSYQELAARRTVWMEERYGKRQP